MPMTGSWLAGAVGGLGLLLWIADASAGLAYVALRDGHWQLYVQAGVAAKPAPVRSDRQDVSAPALSPARPLVAFEVPGDGIHVCELRQATRCRVVRAPRGPAARPAWHPTTGELILVQFRAAAHEEDSDLVVTRNALSEVVPFLAQTGIQDDPDVSPDGRRLVYTVGSTVSLHRGDVTVVQQLWVMDLETSRARQLLFGTVRDMQPDWSPSGNAIAFASDRSGQFEIWVVGADGAGLRQVTRGDGVKTWPAWSPDGKSIMFTVARDGRYSLWIIDEDGKHLRRFEPFGPGSDVEIRDADWR
jgi:dipeptidyl aminopeptidase/acylaminoacyl peptidase